MDLQVGGSVDHAILAELHARAWSSGNIEIEG